jgi:hypothetical protein
MPYQPNYPRTVAEVLDDTMTFRPAALRAMRAFRRLKPWRGTPAEQATKFRMLHEDLCRVYRLRTTLNMSPGPFGVCYDPTRDLIMLPQFSVVSYLHEFGHARGYDERETCRWSINLFRRIFPRSFARCRQEGHMLLRDTPRNPRRPY